jgi:hypothetical protein
MRHKHRITGGESFHTSIHTSPQGNIIYTLPEEINNLALRVPGFISQTPGKGIATLV